LYLREILHCNENKKVISFIHKKLLKILKKRKQPNRNQGGEYREGFAHVKRLLSHGGT
jgi:hypothetical protein